MNIKKSDVAIQALDFCKDGRLYFKNSRKCENQLITFYIVADFDTNIEDLKKIVPLSSQYTQPDFHGIPPKVCICFVILYNIVICCRYLIQDMEQLAK